MLPVIKQPATTGVIEVSNGKRSSDMRDTGKGILLVGYLCGVHKARRTIARLSKVVTPTDELLHRGWTGAAELPNL